MSTHSEPRRWTLETTPSAMDGETHCVRAVGPELVGAEEPSVREDKATTADVEAVAMAIWAGDSGQDWNQVPIVPQAVRAHYRNLALPILAAIFKEGEGR